MNIDRKALATALDDTDKNSHYMVDKKTGKVLKLSLQDPASVADIQKRIAADKARYIKIPKPNPRSNFEELERFVKQLQDPHFRKVCERALTSHRPFREFRDALNTKPKEKRAWETYHQELVDKRIDAFLKGTGLQR